MNVSQIVPLLLAEKVTLDNALASIGWIDTVRNGVRFNQVTVVVFLGTTDIALNAMKMQDSADGVTGTDVTGVVFGTGAAPSLPSATDDNKTYILSVSNKRRYVKPVVGALDGTVGAAVTVMAFLDNPGNATLADLIAGARPTTGQEVII